MHFLVRDSRDSFKRRSFDAFESTSDACLLGELFCRRPVQLGAARAAHCTTSPDTPVVHPSFGFDKSPTSWICFAAYVFIKYALLHSYLQKQIGIGVLASVRERSSFPPAAKSLIKLYKPELVIHRFYIDSLVFCFRTRVQHLGACFCRMSKG